MSTAVIIAGQTRSFERTWDNQYWLVYRKLRDPYFFVSVENDADAYKVECIRERFPKDKIFIETVEQPQLPEPKKDLNHGAYQPSAPAQGILRQFWALNRGWEFFLGTKIPGNPTFDTVVRVRPDLHFHYFRMPRAPDDDEVFSPWWSRWGGMNDRVAVMGLRAAEVYFSTFQNLEAYFKAGAPFHPESLLAYSLEEAGMRSYSTLQAWFTTVRKDGSTIAPDPQWPDLVDYIQNLGPI